MMRNGKKLVRISIQRLTSDEKITDAFIVKDFKTNAYMLSITRHGLVKKTAICEYEVSRNNKTMSNMKLLEDDEVVQTYVAYEEDEILIASKKGYITRYPISLIPATSPRSKGVKAMNLVEDEIASALIYNNDNRQLVVFSDNCACKRMKLTDIDVTGRPTKGSMLCKKVKSKPYHIAYISLHDLNDEIVIANSEIHKVFQKTFHLWQRMQRSLLC